MTMNVKDFLQLVLDKMQKHDENPSEPYFKLQGMGNFSVVFSMYDFVYKISKEQNIQEAGISAGVINRLAEQGINVPYTYGITTSTENFDVVKKIKESVRDSEKIEKFRAALQEIVDTYDSRNGDPTQVCSIMQERVFGERIFKNSRFLYQRLKCVEPKHIVNAIKLQDNLPQELEITDYIIKQTQAEIMEKAQEFYKIPGEHLEKFIYDGLILAKNKIMVDNINKSNFLYSKKSGFYFIDLDGLTSENASRFQVKNKASKPMDYTVENFHGQLYVHDSIYQGELAMQILKFGAKMSTALARVYYQNIEDPFIRQQIEQYVNDSHSKFFKLCAVCHNNLGTEESKQHFDRMDQNIRKMQGTALACSQELE